MLRIIIRGKIIILLLCSILLCSAQGMKLSGHYGKKLTFQFGLGIKVEDDNFQSSPPDSKTLTEYDEKHLADYLRLLDADKENADWKEVVSIIFGFDPDEDESRAKAMHSSHLARAKWISQSGYAQLLKKAE